MRANEFTAEAINPDITNPEFSHQQQIGDYLYVARYWSKGLKITAYHGNKQIGYAELMYQSAPFDDFADPKTTPKRIWLESEWTRVDPKYQRQGIMSTMYAYAKMLGNSVKPSQTRSDDAKAAWKSWRQSGDAQHLTREGVAEGSLNELSKDTLKSYAKKAVPDMQASQNKSKAEYSKAALAKDDETANKHYDAAKQAKDRTEKRMAGVAGAIKRFNKEGVAEGSQRTIFTDEELDAINQYLDDDLSFQGLRTYPGLIRKIASHFGIASIQGHSGEMSFYDRLAQARAEDDIPQQGVAEAFGPLPKDNQQIRLGRHTVDIERVGLDNDHIGFAWHDSQGQEHYEEVAVGDLGSYDDLIKKIKQEISYQERQYTDQGVAEDSMPYPHGKPEAGDKITWRHSNNYPEIEGTVVGWKDGHLIVQSVDPSSRNTEKTVAKYRVPKNNILSVEKQSVAEGYNDLGPEYGGAYVNGRSDDAKMTARLTRQAKAAAAKAGKTFGTSAEYRKWHARQKEKEGVAEGSNDTVYPNATVIKSKNGRPVGEIYQDGNSWGCFHYRADRGYDMIDSREDAIQALKDLHQETGRSGPDYTIKGVAEKSHASQ